MSRKHTPTRPVSRLPRPADLVTLSARLLEAKCCRRVDRLPPAGRPLDLIAFNPAGNRLLVARAVPRRERFAALVELLGDGRLARLCCGGVAAVQLHAWDRRPWCGRRCWVCEIIELGAGDFIAAAPAVPGGPPRPI